MPLKPLASTAGLMLLTIEDSIAGTAGTAWAPGAVDNNAAIKGTTTVVET